MSLHPTSYINSLPMYVPPEFAGILPVSPSTEHCAFEPLCFQGLHAVIEPGATVYDVGASYGVMTALIALLAGRNGQVVSFEPNPSVMALGTRLLETNGLSKRVRQVNALVGEASTSGIPFFFVPGRGSVASTRNTDILHFHPDAAQVKLDMIALDDFDGPVPSVMKIDIEGSEFQLLQGARKLLETHHPDLVIETHGLEINGIAGSVSELCRSLEQMGYSLWDLGANEPSTTDSYAGTYGEKIGYLVASVHLDAVGKRLYRRY